MQRLRYSVIATLISVAATSLAATDTLTPIQLVKSLQISEIVSAPTQITIELYDSQDGLVPIDVQTFYEGEWDTNMDLSSGLPETGTIRFSMTIDPRGIPQSGETLWAETSLDGQVIGKRSIVQAATSPPKFIIEGEIETKGVTGGIRFPDDSFQDSASPLVTGDGATTTLDMNNNTISNLPTPSDGGDAVSLSYLQTYVSSNGDNLGNHTATGNIRLNGSWLSNDGGNEGIVVDDIGQVGIGTNTPSASLHVASGNGALFEGDGGAIPKEGPGGRMMWYASRSAFRAGLAVGDTWNADEIISGTVTVTDGSSLILGSGTQFTAELSVGNVISWGNHRGIIKSIDSDTQLTTTTYAVADYAGLAELVHIGLYSVATGRQTTASGWHSTAIGWNTTANSNSSTAMGKSSVARGYGSTAMGLNTTASGYGSTAMGVWTEAVSDYGTVIGKNNNKVANRLFTIGNGISKTARSNAMVVTNDGDTGIGHSYPATRLHVADSIDGDGNQLASYVGLFHNTSSGASADALAIKIGTLGDPSTAANLIGFFDGENDLIGQIEGNGSGGVAYNTSGADYAEYLPQRDEGESLSAGDIVGVFAGKITRDTANATQVMVITDRAAVLGNMPKGKDKVAQHHAVSFIGQVPVKVHGVVTAGDVVIASGQHDGTGIAVSVNTLGQLERAQIVGRAWASSKDPGLKKVIVAVGLDHTDMAMMQVKHLQAAFKVQQQEMLAQRQEIVALRAELAEYKLLTAEVQQIKNQLMMQPQLMARVSSSKYTQ